MRRREIRPTQSGELRHVADIEALVQGTDAVGAPLTSYVTWAKNVFFAIDDWKPYEKWSSAQLDSSLYTRIRIRWRPGVEPTMRLVHRLNPGAADPQFDYYDIIGVVRDISLRVELQLACMKHNAPGFRVGTADYPPATGVPPGGP